MRLSYQCVRLVLHLFIKHQKYTKCRPTSNHKKWVDTMFHTMILPQNNSESTIECCNECGSNMSSNHDPGWNISYDKITHHLIHLQHTNHYAHPHLIPPKRMDNKHQRNTPPFLTLRRLCNRLTLNILNRQMTETWKQ